MAERHLIKINITCWIMIPGPNTWWNLATVQVILQKILDCAELMPIRFVIDSDQRRMSFWIYGVQNTNSNIHLIWIVLKPNIKWKMYISNIQHNIIINFSAQDGNMGNCHPSKTNVYLDFTLVDIFWKWSTILHERIILKHT